MGVTRKILVLTTRPMVALIPLNTKGNYSNGGKKKSDYCWNFNRGIPCKFGNRCKFIERCKYCDSPSHGVNNCQKLQKKSEGAAKPVQESSNNK